MPGRPLADLLPPVHGAPVRAVPPPSQAQPGTLHVHHQPGQVSDLGVHLSHTVPAYVDHTVPAYVDHTVPAYVGHTVPAYVDHTLTCVVNPMVCYVLYGLHM